MSADGQVITTNTDPQGNNTEGNGITGVSGGTYGDDSPEYISATATLPAGTTDVRFRYSTDAGYLDTGWFVTTSGRRHRRRGEPAGGRVDADRRAGAGQQLVRPAHLGCDLTPGVDSDFEIRGREDSTSTGS